MKPTISLFWTQIDCDKPDTVYIQARYGSGSTVGHLRLDADDKAGWIAALYVSPEYRGKGLASLLIQRAVCVCRCLGYETVGLSVAHENDRAKKLYKRLGFLEWTNGHPGFQQYVKPV